MMVPFYKNQIKLNHPTKVLSSSVTDIRGLEFWPHPNGTDDPWYSGAISRKYYRWEITMRVSGQRHGSHLTRDDFEYNGLDVIVGDWIAGASDGKALKIIEISAKTRTTVTCVVEDWLRYNTFKSASGNGMFSGGSAVIFTLNEDGNPILDSVPTTVSSQFYYAVTSRFHYFNPQINFVLYEPDHGLKKNDVVSVTNDGYVKSNSLTASQMIGVVTEAGPGPDYFIISPNNRIVSFDPGIPGDSGDYVYVSPSGELTNTSDPNANKTAFIVVKKAEPTVIRSTQSSVTVPNGTVLTVNNTDVTLTGDNGTANAQEVVNLINVDSNLHLVVGTIDSFPTQLVSNTSQSNYGVIGGYAPFSAYIDSGSGNTLVTFNTSGSQYANIASPQDMATDINAANIANLSATGNVSTLIIEETNGNAVTITNASGDINGIPFAGNSSITGFDLTYEENTDDRITLTREDGGEILIYEDSDVFQTETGIVSAHTGTLPLAMNISRGVRTSGGTIVVGTIADRDSLTTPIIGDQVYVTNTGSGEWALYLYTGDVGTPWEMISNADSATTDAKTLTHTFNLQGSGITSNGNMGRVSLGRKITTVSVIVEEELSGFTQMPVIRVGTDIEPNLFLSPSHIDLTDTTTFFVSPEYVYDDGDASINEEMLVRTVFDHYGATGRVVVKVTYV